MNREVARKIAHFLTPSLEAVSFPAAPGEMGRWDWEHTLNWLDHSGTTLLFWKRLKGMGQENQIPPEIGKRLTRNFVDHRLRVTRMLSEFHSINSHFEAEGLPYAVLKGFALIPEYCSDVCLRPSYDYDYLLHPESMSKAGQALAALGFVRKRGSEDDPIVYFHGDRPPRRPHGRDDLYTGAFPRTIELHCRFWDAGTLRIPLAVPTDLLARREARELISPAWSGATVRYHALSREDELIFQSLHVFRHILRNWCRLCSLLDIAYFLEHSAPDCAFWNSFLDRLGRNQRLTEIVGLVFLLAASVFGASIPEPVSAEVVANLRRPLTLWIKRYGVDSALSNFSNNKFSLFLHHEFIQDDACWRHIRRTQLFPAHWPNSVFHATDRTPLAHLGAGSKQLVYVFRRLSHHLAGALRYGWEAPFWGRARRRSPAKR